MGKRLRKQIRESCGLEGLERTERRKRAQDILDSLEFKQRLCNKTPGLSFKDIEKTMKNILNENQPTAAEQEEEELRRVAPEKFDIDTALESGPRKVKKVHYKTLTEEETRELMKADNTPVKQEPNPPAREYGTYTEEETRALMACDYNPADFMHKKS